MWHLSGAGRVASGDLAPPATPAATRITPARLDATAARFETTAEQDLPERRPPVRRNPESRMIIIGFDPHRRVYTASAVETATNRRLASLEAEASLTGYRR